MELATGTERWATSDALGWASSGGLVDIGNGFSTPSVAQTSIRFTCAVESGAVVPSWMGENGPRVSSAGGQQVACAGILAPFGAADADEPPVETDVAEDAPVTGFVHTFISKGLAGAEARDLKTLRGIRRQCVR